MGWGRLRGNCILAVIASVVMVLLDSVCARQSDNLAQRYLLHHDGSVLIFKKTKICYGEAINSADLTIETRQDLKKSTNLIMDNIKKLREDKIENISC